MRAYIVGRGEDLHSIAARIGFDPSVVWAASENQALRELRGDPQVLAAGDTLYVPEVADTELAVTAKTTNEFTADIEYVDVCLNLSAGGSEARSGEPYEVHGLRNVVSGASDSDGRISFQVPAHVRTVRVLFPDQGSSTRVRLGHLDPTTENQGIRTRLFNLGYLASEDMLGPRLARTQTPEARHAELADAVRHFQADEGINETGELDEATRIAIRGRHGQ